MVRLAALGVIHEANTFSVFPMDAATFQDSGPLVGDDVVAGHAGGTTTMSGFLAAGELPDVEVVPLVMTMLTPRGPFTADAFDACVEQLVSSLRDNGPFDGVLAALHGAAVADNHPDADGFLLRRFRQEVGPNVPIGVALDLHANISSEMCQHADVLNTYRTNPHLDAGDTALEVAELIVRTVRGEIRPTLAFEPIPAAINILRQDTDASPMRNVIADARRTMEQAGVLSATVSEGFPYADVAEMGMAVVVVTDNDAAGAAEQARQLAASVWARRAEFEAVAPTAVEAAAAVRADGSAPTLLLDVGDNIGGGGPGDSVVLLNAAREVGLEDLLIIVADPESYARCEAAGVRAEVTLSIGAKSYPETGPPVVEAATVLSFDPGVYDAAGESVHGGIRRIDAGPSCAVRLASGQTVILTSKTAMPLSIKQLTRLGLDPAAFAAIVAKGVHSPKATYRPYVRTMVLVDTPGPTSADLQRFTYRHRRRPMLPFEAGAALR